MYGTTVTPHPEVPVDTLTASPIRTRPPALAALAAVALLLAAPGPVAADPDRTAYELRAEAMDIANLGQLEEAAEFLILTAADLSDDDQEKDDNLRLAGRLYHHAGKLDAAWRTMVNAGVAAYRLGDARQAGHDLVDATVVAVQTGDAIRAWDTAEKVGYVLRTTDLAPEERMVILERIRIEPRETRRG